MKRVKTKADLNKMALSTGARLESTAGKRFNSAGAKAKPLPPEAPGPKRLEKAEFRDLPPPAPPPPPALPPPVAAVSDESINILADKIEQAGNVNAEMLVGLRQQITEIQFHSERPVLDWDFEFIRDSKGYLARIKAHAEIVKPTLN